MLRKEVIPRIYSWFSRFVIYMLLKRRFLLKSHKDSRNLKISEFIKEIEDYFNEKKEANNSNNKAFENLKIKSKSFRSLVSSLNASDLKESDKDDEFYLLVAHKWVEGYEKKFHKTSYLMLHLFILFAVIVVFFDQHMTTSLVNLMYLGLIFIFPIIGFGSAILGKGWTMLCLCITHFFLFFIGVAMYLIIYL
ncbi:hypothetical protein [Alkalibacillus haloalkaliphilus]|uniref:hypothetical protein n=1 Tax=Alkalibacillus haloalkaliphilus TaxID=94136 RepID=UPI002936087A|nr:hypothetical protein [Alkalibacillus haloalkaliphilus]MDV2582249.1 hypothetical protein [Alkalibacillus haloalkaliphilus]